MIRVPRSLATLAIGFAAASASCFDPVHSDDVAALGGEVSGVRTGPTHRPGQPCLVCHGGKGPGSPEFEIAGTIYEKSGDSAPAEGVEITITDSSSPPQTFALQSNRAGNFYLEKDRKTLYYPLHIELNDSRITDVPVGVKTMITTVGHNGGCSFCHVNNINDADRATHMPHVYLNK